MSYIDIPVTDLSHDHLKNLASEGFSLPYCYFNRNKKQVILRLGHTTNSTEQPTRRYNRIIYYLSQFKLDLTPSKCFLKFRLHPSSIVSLYDCLNEPNEIAGSFDVEFEDDIVATLHIKDKVEGESTRVRGPVSKCTFHSHPKEAYKSYNVQYAWPSLDDYRAFVTMFVSDKAIVHILSSIEGVYIISMTTLEASLEEMLNECKIYDIPYDTCDSPKTFCEAVNAKQSICNTEFCTWEECVMGKVFSIDFKRNIDGSCSFHK